MKAVEQERKQKPEKDQQQYSKKMDDLSRQLDQ